MYANKMEIVENLYTNYYLKDFQKVQSDL